MRNGFLAKWPTSAGKVSGALNSNHEMYSGGEGYFDLTLPAFKQSSNYFAIENSAWLLICLDTGYNDFTIDDQQAKWVAHVAAAIPAKRIVLFSHHQLFSLFDDQGPKLARQLHGLLNSGRVAAWYCGHEHRCVLYDAHPIFKLRKRCIGHGGMPYTRGSERNHPVGMTTRSPGTVWRNVPGVNLVPTGLVLDGPNPYIEGKAAKYGPNGYMTLEFNGDRIVEKVFAPDGGDPLFSGEIR